MPNTDRAQIAAIAASPFLGAARAETMLRDFDKLRALIRPRADQETQDAWDQCERWIGCIDPRKVGT